MLGTQDLLIGLAIVVVLFGAKKLPELAKGIGESIRNFKKGMSETDEIDVTPKEVESEKKEAEKKEAEKKEAEKK